MIALESKRPTIRELAAEDLPLLMPVRLSNPAFLGLVEGSKGEAGRYDLARWQRDWQSGVWLAAHPHGHRGAQRGGLRFRVHPGDGATAGERYAAARARRSRALADSAE